MNRLSISPLFTVASLRAVELTDSDIALLQQFFDANPEYFQSVTGLPARSNEAVEEFRDLPPAGMTYNRRLQIGFFDESGAMVAMAGVLGEFIAESVWHIGLFVVATAMHGNGMAPMIYRELEGWMRNEGAQWIRLGVVQGNTRAERFWEKMGYREVRTRPGVEMGSRVNTLRVMAKSLAGSELKEYLARVVRDRPD